MPVSSSFVGRTTELDQLEEALDAAERRESRAVQIIGPAGIGKTRLLAELARRADERGHVRLFTPARYDSLAGMPFPGDPDRYPMRDEVVDYLTA